MQHYKLWVRKFRAYYDVNHLAMLLILIMMICDWKNENIIKWAAYALFVVGSVIMVKVARLQHAEQAKPIPISATPRRLANAARIRAVGNE